MRKPLIIVESPTKARTIKKFLPARFVVKASVGHVRDLPKSSLGVDVEHGFQPRYLTIKGKGDLIKELRSASRAASEVYLATDPDREGEAIAWHLAELLKLEDPKRIELHEITKDAALAALAAPHSIDMDRVNAQQARRILDRLVGYKISPLLWAKVRGGLSAGRVQSVAVKLIVDREREIQGFVPREYWTIAALLAPLDSSAVFAASLHARDGTKVEVSDAATAQSIVADLEGARFRVASVKQRETRRNPAAPFTTSTLQQEASRKLKFRVRRTMQLAQALYEGVDLGKDGTQGLITYMRTDSTRISDSARDAAKLYVETTFRTRILRWRPDAQASRRRPGCARKPSIRPTSMIDRPPASVSGHPQTRRAAPVPPDLGTLRRFPDGRGDLRSNHGRRGRATPLRRRVRQFGLNTSCAQTGSVLKFAGFTAVYEEGRERRSCMVPRRRRVPTNARTGRQGAAASARRSRPATTST